jgi:twinkle protein
MAEADCEPCLFGWQALDKSTRLVVLCEGEIDCMTFTQLGYDALSVPFGGGKGAKQQWIEYEYHNLDRFTEVWLCLDNDDVGARRRKKSQDAWVSTAAGLSNYPTKTSTSA